MINGEATRDKQMEYQHRHHHGSAPDAQRNQNAQRDIDGFYHHELDSLLYEVRQLSRCFALRLHRAGLL